MLSYLRSEQDLNYQVSAFTKYSTAHFHPDALGDIAFNGIAQDTERTSFANGVQADGSYKLSATHTLRAGLLLTGEKVQADTNSSVLPVVDPATGRPQPDAGSASSTIRKRPAGHTVPTFRTNGK